MIATLKTFARTVPAARSDPFYGLDRSGDPGLRMVERMTAHGDFRKYVFVLDAGGGLGRIARWLAVTYGCRVLILDLFPRLLAAGQRLTNRAGLGRIAAVAGDFAAIPLRDGTFTQIWSHGALHHAAQKGRALRELFRVLRPGSTLGLHETVRRSDAVPEIGGAWRHGTAAEYLELLATSGFTSVACEDVTAEGREVSALTRPVEETFLRLLGERSPTEAAAWRRTEEALRAVETIVRGPDYRSVQFFARRPSL